MPALQPIQRRSLSDAVFEQLRGQILSGAMPPGSALPSERDLCTKLAVNRGALREALKRLQQARLVDIQHGGGTRVVDFFERAGLDLLATLLVAKDGHINTRVARSVVEMRSALAPDIARLAARRATQATKAQLVALTDRFAETGDLAQRQRLAMEFWRLLVEASDNVAYRLAYNTLRETYERIFDVLTKVLSLELADASAYREIAAAVADGREIDAESRARDLVHCGAGELTDLVDALEAMETHP